MKVNPVCNLEYEPQTQLLRGTIYYLVLLVPRQAAHSFPPTVLYSSPSLLGSSETFPCRISTGNCWQSVMITDDQEAVIHSTCLQHMIQRTSINEGTC